MLLKTIQIVLKFSKLVFHFLCHKLILILVMFVFILEISNIIELSIKEFLIKIKLDFVFVHSIFV